MRQIRHPLSGALYELDSDGNVLVTKEAGTGTFTANGRWLAGEVRTADPELCRWIGNPLLATSGAQSRRFAKPTEAIPGGA